MCVCVSLTKEWVGFELDFRDMVSCFRFRPFVYEESTSGIDYLIVFLWSVLFG